MMHGQRNIKSEKECVYCAVRVESFNQIKMKFHLPSITHFLLDFSIVYV